uniref:Uncharacterized protein n=1 Tax=Thermorudis peleae TaxID=1382356 RepID=A0A831TFP0_9BACT
MAVVYDATSIVECHLEVQVDNGPWETQPCAPGTIMAAEILPRDLADRHPRSVIVELTGNEDTDAALIAKAVQELHDGLRAQGITPTACSAHSKTIRGRYNIGDGYIVEYEISYIGWQYTNQTERCSFLRCITYYGYWYFD